VQFERRTEASVIVRLRASSDPTKDQRALVLSVSGD
jgi:hypothetical protein